MPTTMLLRKLEQVMVLSETEHQTISELPKRVLHVKPRCLACQQLHLVNPATGRVLKVDGD